MHLMHPTLAQPVSFAAAPGAILVTFGPLTMRTTRKHAAEILRTAKANGWRVEA